MTDGPGEITVYIMLLGVALFIVAAAVAGLAREMRVAVNTWRQRRAHRRFKQLARERNRRRDQMTAGRDL